MDKYIVELFENRLGINDITAISKYLILNERQIPELIAKLQDSSDNYKKNAGWVLMHIAKQDITKLVPYQEICVNAAFHYQDERILRNLLFVSNALLEQLSNQEKEKHFRLYEYCIHIAESESYAPGTRSNALSILEQFCMMEPELATEISLVAASIIDYASPGLKSKANKVLHSLNRRKYQTREDTPK